MIFSNYGTKGGRDFKSPLFCIQIPHVTEFATLLEEATNSFNAELQALLDKYKGVFEEPTRLPIF